MMELTHDQKKNFYDEGFLKVENVVPKIMVEEALKEINHSIGRLGIHPNKLREYGARSFCPELTEESSIVDMFHKTPAKELIGSMLNINQMEQVSKGQIALRFPNGENKVRPPSNPHLDGTYAPANSVNEGEIRNFTALVCVILSDLPEENSGNFIVWPGTHHLFGKYFQKHGAETMKSFKDGVPPVEMPNPVQITGKAGDIVIAHYSLAHTAMGNFSHHIRYATFFRIKHLDINSTNWKEPVENIWMHWEGMS